MQIVANAREYMEMGVVKFEKILAIPLKSRIPNLTHIYGFEKIHATVMALLTKYSNSLNLIRPMSADQITQCAYDLVLTSEEDQLSIEDFVLFFKGAAEGKYGKILDRLDQQTIFSMLAIYREDRHKSLMEYRENKHLELKGLGDGTRYTPKNELGEELGKIMERMSSKNERIKELTEHMKRQNEINNF